MLVQYFLLISSNLLAANRLDEVMREATQLLEEADPAQANLGPAVGASGR